MWDHQDGGLLSSELVKKSREKILNGEARTNVVGCPEPWSWSMHALQFELGIGRIIELKNMYGGHL